MSREDELVTLAEQIADGLTEVSRNEWMKWVQIFYAYYWDKHHDALQRAIHYAQRLSRDPTMRPAIRRAHDLIAKTIQSHARRITSLPLPEQQRLFGYVAWNLVVQSKGGRRR
ncbi:MAG: hypothetical protein DRO01_00695 [Thermoproteota archaeon]|nr:MAG: hypothetical protein DRO01_00695 [Candidatus Korarchaeota archaeon]